MMETLFHFVLKLLCPIKELNNITHKPYLHVFQLFFWSCRSVYRRQDVCVAKVILWILSSCTYWWENRYPYPPLLHDGTTPHSWLMTPLPILG